VALCAETTRPAALQHGTLFCLAGVGWLSCCCVGGLPLLLACSTGSMFAYDWGIHAGAARLPGWHALPPSLTTLCCWLYRVLSLLLRSGVRWPLLIQGCLNVLPPPRPPMTLSPPQMLPELWHWM